jgi:hypothetical protein
MEQAVDKATQAPAVSRDGGPLAPTPYDQPGRVTE